MIEAGRSYSVDFCFRSFILMFPMYLKKKVIDFKGNFVNNEIKKNGSQSSSNNSISSTDSTTLDVKIEEDLGKSLMTQFKIRLSLQALVDSRKPNTYVADLLSIVFSFLFGMTMFIVTYVIFINYFDGRYDDTLTSINFNVCRTELVTIYLFSILKWAEEIPDPRFSKENYVFEDENIIESSSMLRDKELSEMVFIHNSNARENYNKFLFDLADGSIRGENIFALTPSLFDDLIELKYCKDGKPIEEPMKMDFKSALSYNFVITRMLASLNANMSWFNTNRYMCSIFSNRFSFASNFRQLRANLVDGQIDKAKNVEQFILTLRILMPVLMFLFDFFPSLFVMLLFVKEINCFAKLMLKTETKFKKDAQMMLSKKHQETIGNTTNNEAKPSRDIKIIIFYIIFILIDLILAILLYLAISQADGMNAQFENTATWSFKSSVRIPNSIDTLTSVFLSILLSGNRKMSSQFTFVENEINFAQGQIKVIDQYREDLLNGDDRIPTIIGFDPMIDYLMLSETCVADISSGDLHELYACGSMNQIMTFYKNIVTDVIAKIDDMNSTLNNHQSSTLLHILCFHIQPTLELISSRMDVLVNNFVTSYQQKLTIIFIIGLIIVIIKTALSFMFLNVSMNTYKGGMMMLKRLSPIGIFSNNQLFDYLLNKKTEKVMSEQNVSKSIINASSDCIMCLGNGGIIEIVNPSVQMTFGYTPEQLLGQSFIVIFEDDSIQKQLDLMATGQSGASYKGHANCITGSEEKVSCSITLLLIDSDSFVLIIRDEHELFINMELAEEAKKKSEDLLFQILPRDIVNRLNQGERDISFQVPSATICFIDVVKFSEYAASLSPEMIMGNLSIMFSGFDECLSKYKTLTKIKLIGDVYMCAAGLFSSDIEPKVHAEEMIKFALDALTSLEDTCNKLNAMLNVRIGINTGGPLIAGVLGTDKPVFDIIGDPINIASRLQSTDVIGFIQISQTTYELIQSLDCEIECRGEVFLKGKGKSSTYLVKPTTFSHLSDTNHLFTSSTG